MLKSEYDRNYRWLSKDDLDCDVNYSRKVKAMQEPRMDHKRRVRPVEDSVIIGEPLPSQKEQDESPNDAYFVLGKQNERFNDSVGFYKARQLTEAKKPRRIRSKSPPKRRKEKAREKVVLNEGVQTAEFDDKMVQTSDRNKENREVVRPSTAAAPRPFGRVLTEYSRNYEAKLDKSVPEKPIMDKKSQNKSKWDLKLKIYNNCMSEYQRQFKPYEYVTENQYSRMRPRHEEITQIQRPGAPSNQLQFVPDTKPRRAVTPPPNYKYEDNQSVLTESTISQSNNDHKKSMKSNYKKVKTDQTYIKPTKPDQSNLRPSKIDQSNYKASKLDLSNVKPPKIRLSRSPSPQPIMNRTFPPSSLIKSARNPHKPYFPHGRSQTNKFRTEYSENFDNKWTLLQNESENELENEENLRGMSARSAISANQPNQASKWFKEIMELRKKASEYRQRSRGTHLSREHIGQVYTKQQEQEERASRNGRRKRTHSSRRSSPVNKSRSTSRSTTRLNNQTQWSGRNSVGSASELSSEASTLTQQRRRVVQGWSQQRPAGVPSFDNNILLDEEASHDTDFKKSPLDEFLEINDEHEDDYNGVGLTKPSDTGQRKYTLQKYFNPQYHPSRDNRALKYDDVNQQISLEHSRKPKSVSTQSIVSSSTMSLAKETLERARRNRDEILRQKI